MLWAIPKKKTEQQAAGDRDDKKLSGRDIEVLSNETSRGLKKKWNFRG